MVENIQVRDGDMVTMARIVNSNTKNLDSRIKGLTNDCNRVFGLIDQDVTKLEKRVRFNNKQIGRLALCVFGLDLILIGQMIRMRNLEKKIAQLEEENDKKIVDDFMKDEEEPDFLK